MDSSDNYVVTYLRFFGRQDGKLVVLYRAPVGEYKQLLLPSSSSLMESMLRSMCRTLVILGLRFDDATLTRLVPGESRRALHRVLTRIFFGCERCGDLVTHKHVTDDAEHNYCTNCYNEVVLDQCPHSDWRLHAGWNLGNQSVEEHDRLYHGDGFEI